MNTAFYFNKHIMKTLLQQLKPTLLLYKRASILLFLFLITFTSKAQSFYFVNGTQITIDENTTLFVTDSGKVDQTRLTDFEGKIITQKYTLNETKQVAFNDKKSKLLSEKYKKDSRLKSIKEKAKNYSEVEQIELIKICPDNFFSPNQKGIGISGSITVQYNLKFLIENIRL
jgi:ferredoxin-like protein FixX